MRDVSHTVSLQDVSALAQPWGIVPLARLLSLKYLYRPLNLIGEGGDEDQQEGDRRDPRYGVPPELAQLMMPDGGIGHMVMEHESPNGVAQMDPQKVKPRLPSLDLEEPAEPVFPETTTGSRPDRAAWPTIRYCAGC